MIVIFSRLIAETDLATRPNSRDENILLFLVQTVGRQMVEQRQYRPSRPRKTAAEEDGPLRRTGCRDEEDGRRGGRAAEENGPQRRTGSREGWLGRDIRDGRPGVCHVHHRDISFWKEMSFWKEISF